MKKDNLFQYSKFVLRAADRPERVAEPVSSAADAEVHNKFTALRERAGKIESAVHEAHTDSDKIQLLHELGFVDNKIFIDGLNFFEKENSGFGKTIDGNPIETNFKSALEGSIGGMMRVCNRITMHPENPTREALDHYEEKWRFTVQTIKREMEASAKESFKRQAYLSAHGVRRIQNKFIDELRKNYPGLNPDEAEAKKIIAKLKKEISETLYHNNAADLQFLPDLKNGELDLNEIYNNQSMQGLISSFILHEDIFFDRFEPLSRPAAPEISLPGTPYWNDAESNNKGKIKDVNGLDVSEVITPAMENSLEKLDDNDFYFRINPPLPETAYFRAGVYNQLDTKGTAFNDSQPFSQPGITPNNAGAPEYLMTGTAKNSGSFTIPVPSGFAVSEVVSPAGAVLTKNENGIYKLTFSGVSEAEQRITFKIFENNEDIANQPKDEDKMNFLGNFRGKPNFPSINIAASSPSDVMSMVERIRGYLNANTVYDSGSNLSGLASNYYGKEGNFYAALEERKFAYDEVSGPELILADSGIANMYFVGLCRSSGIPARMVTGYMAKEKVGFSSMQAWAEVWDGGKWVRVDASPTRSLKAEHRDTIYNRMRPKPQQTVTPPEPEEDDYNILQPLDGLASETNDEREPRQRVDEKVRTGSEGDQQSQDQQSNAPAPETREPAPRDEPETREPAPRDEPETQVDDTNEKNYDEAVSGLTPDEMLESFSDIMNSGDIDEILERYSDPDYFSKKLAADDIDDVVGVVAEFFDGMNEFEKGSFSPTENASFSTILARAEQAAKDKLEELEETESEDNEPQRDLIKVLRRFIRRIKRFFSKRR